MSKPGAFTPPRERKTLYHECSVEGCLLRTEARHPVCQTHWDDAPKKLRNAYKKAHGALAELGERSAKHIVSKKNRARRDKQIAGERRPLLEDFDRARAALIESVS